MKIAVLVPVYNAEKYLRECLDSLLAQQGVDLEIFCCNDGSTDRSQMILDDYVSRHRNVHAISQANAGVAVTRNRLMDALPADFDVFAFCDSDDTVAPGMYAKLAEALVRTGADVAETQWNGPETVLDDRRVYLLRRTAQGKQWINVINKLYRRTVVGTIRFREGLKFEEDFYFNFEVHQAIRRKVLVPGDYYYYRPNPTSATSVLDLRDYFESCSHRIRLSCEEFLLAGRIPADLEPSFRVELAKDAYRMCIRKNLKKNVDPASRREIFDRAGAFFSELERTAGFRPDGLNAIQRLIYRCCRNRRYHLARVLSALT